MTHPASSDRPAKLEQARLAVRLHLEQRLELKGCLQHNARSLRRLAQKVEPMLCQSMSEPSTAPRPVRRPEGFSRRARDETAAPELQDSFKILWSDLSFSFAGDLLMALDHGRGTRTTNPSLVVKFCEAD